MYFVKFSLVLLSMVLFDQVFGNREVCMKKIIQKSRELKEEVDKLYEISKGNCNANPSIKNDLEFEKMVSDYLRMNFTLSREASEVSRKQTPNFTDHQTVDSNQTKIENSKTIQKNAKGGFFTKLKHIFGSLFGGDSNLHPEARLKRCLLIHLFDMDVLQSRNADENEFPGLTPSEIKEIDEFLHNFMLCLNSRVEKENEVASSSKDNVEKGKGGVEHGNSQTESSRVTKNPAESLKTTSLPNANATNTKTTTTSKPVLEFSGMARFSSFA